MLRTHVDMSAAFVCRKREAIASCCLEEGGAGLVVCLQIDDTMGFAREQGHVSERVRE